MAPILLLNNSQKKTKKYLKEFCDLHEIEPVHVFHLEPQNKEISIDQVREVKKQIIFTFTEPRVFIFHNFDTASYQAQNALLKTLEEHNPNVFFILEVTNLHSMLPTIRSRCIVVNLKKDDVAVFDVEIKKKIEKLTASKQINLSFFTVTNAQDALNLIEQFLLYFRMKLAKDKYATQAIRDLLKTRSLIVNNNINPQFAIDHFLISAKKIYS